MKQINVLFAPILVVGLLAIGGLTKGDDKPKPGHFEVVVEKDIAYNGEDDNDPKHKLDLYLPKGQKNFPVLFFVHGGAWQHGDRQTWFDLYGNLGKAYAQRGIGTVVISYRLSPKVQHPAHIQDVAKAFAWTHRNIAKYGGDPDNIVISGHSAGGHLVALLATDPSYLKAENLSIDNIKAVIPVSGVYVVPPGRLFSKVFGSDDKVRHSASPINQVNGKHPPFLIMYADADFPTCGEVSEGFCKALKDKKCDATSLEMKKRDHISILVSFYKTDDPAMEAVLEFFCKHTGHQLPGKEAAPPKDK